MTKDGRLLAVLDAFDLEHRALTVSEITARTEEPQSSVYRSVRALKEAGFLVADEAGVYRLDTKFLKFASIVRADNDLIAVSTALMGRLAQEVRQTVILCVRSADKTVVVNSAPSGRPFGVTVPAGKIFPLTFGASARVLLAFLDGSEQASVLQRCELPEGRTIESLTGDLERIREQGYDQTMGVYEPGIFACAAPIFEESVEGPVASLSVVGVPDSVEGELDRLIPPLLETAATISERLG